MFASFLATLFFSLSVILAARSAKILGGAVANLGRIGIATVILAVWAHGLGIGISGPGFPWFFLSGIIGFGLGDMALFGSLTRIGPRLAILLTQCLAAPIAAFAEWAWLGTTLHISELLCALVILGGVAVALAPDHGWEGERRVFWIGVLFGIGSALGQALGAVVSRKANLISELAGFEIDGGTAAYQRALGGVLTTIIAFWLFRKRRASEELHLDSDRWKQGWPIVVGNALAGPSIGVACYQWALRSTPSGVVLPIVATAPLVTIILSWFLDRQRPTLRAAIGGVIAVGGAGALSVMRTSG